MAFNTITVGYSTYQSIGNGLYNKTGLSFDDPPSTIKINPGKKANKTAPISAAITRSLTVEVLNSSDEVIDTPKSSVTCQFNIAPGMTTTQLVSLLADIAAFATTTNLERILQGES